MLKIKDLMLDPPLLLKKEYTLQKAAREMYYSNVEGAPVIDGGGKLIGVFTKHQLLKALAVKSRLNDLINLHINTDIMILNANDKVEDILKCSFDELECLPVVNEKRQVIGVISKENIIKMLTVKYKRDIYILDAVLNSVHNGICAINSKGHIILFNPAAEKIMGVNANAALGQPIEKIIPHTKMHEVLKTGKSQFSRKIILNGITVITNRTPIFLSNGEIAGAVAVFQDISELELISKELRGVKRLNRELDAIIESSHDGIVVADSTGKLLKVSKAYERITGIRPKELEGKNMREVVSEGMVSESVTLQVLREKKLISIMQEVKTGKTMLVTGVPVFDEDGLEVIRVVTTCRDLTELNDLYNRLERAEKLTEKYQDEIAKLKSNQLKSENIVVQSKAMRQIIDMAEKVAEVDTTVLILGESGVGKEVVARLIHKKSMRAEGPFIRINCGAIPEQLLESELFGYESGAFTGARKSGKPGMFEMADGGTLFLDEIAELPFNLQVKLLNVLQDLEVRRLGGTRQVKVDVRLIAATNQNLFDKVQRDEFRADLYYRLNVVDILVPPLRDRKEDIPFLAMHFLEKNKNKYGIQKKITTEIIDYLYNYHWPGNIRELENIVERLIVTSKGDVINVSDLPKNLQMLYRQSTEDKTAGKHFSYNSQKEELKHLYYKYRSTRKVAKILGVHQSTIVRWMKKYGISAKQA